MAAAVKSVCTAHTGFAERLASLEREDTNLKEAVAEIRADVKTLLGRMNGFGLWLAGIFAGVASAAILLGVNIARGK